MPPLRGEPIPIQERMPVLGEIVAQAQQTRAYVVQSYNPSLAEGSAGGEQQKIICFGHEHSPEYMTAQHEYYYDGQKGEGSTTYLTLPTFDSQIARAGLAANNRILAYAVNIKDQSFVLIAIPALHTRKPVTSSNHILAVNVPRELAGDFAQEMGIADLATRREVIMYLMGQASSVWQENEAIFRPGISNMSVQTGSIDLLGTLNSDSPQIQRIVTGITVKL